VSAPNDARSRSDLAAAFTEVSDGPATRGHTFTVVDAAPSPAEFTARNRMLAVA
jgi:hypothetical protein